MLLAEVSSFERLTFWLAVAGLGIAIIALLVAVMALPTVFQMIWGRPKVDISFEESVGDVLLCTFGQPFVAPWLRHLGVRRAPIEISVTIEIKNHAGETIAFTIADLRHLDGPLGKFMTVTPSIFPSVQTRVAWQRDKHWLCRSKDGEKSLEEGTYDASLFVLYAGTDITKETRPFSVTPGGGQWC
jgi:hypothetical protein